MLSLLAVTALSVAPIKLAAPGLQNVGIDPRVGDALISRFVVELGKAGGFKITTKEDIAQVLGLERQRQLLGCADATGSCLTELMGGLGVDGIITGTLAKVGSTFTIALRVVRAVDGAEVATASARVKSEDALQDWLESETAPLAAEISRALRPEGPAPGAPGQVSASRAPGRVLSLLPGIAGVVLAATGGVLFALGKGDASQLQMRPVTLNDAMLKGLADTGSAFEPAGVALLCVGLAAVAASVVLLLLGSST